MSECSGGGPLLRGDTIQGQRGTFKKKRGATEARRNFNVAD